MPEKSLNQVLAQRLGELMADNISARSLAEKAGLSPRTTGNYLAPEQAFTAAKGKERSAKLAEIELLAHALGVPPLALLMDQGQRADMLRFLANEMASAVAQQPVSLPTAERRTNRLISNPWSGAERRHSNRKAK